MYQKHCYHHILCYLFAIHLFLGIYQGKLALWKEGCTVPEQIYPLQVQSLPAADQALLEQGIPLDSPQALTQRLEDLLS